MKPAEIVEKGRAVESMPADVTRRRMNKLKAYNDILDMAVMEDRGSGKSKNLMAVQRELCRTDLFYLFVFVLGRSDGNNDWVFARCEELQAQPDGFLDLWGRYHYKAVDVNEPVPTPKGMVKHGDLLPGDTVFGSNGKTCKVVGRTEVFTDAECFRVTFDTGYSVVVSGEHLWTVGISSKVRVGGGTNSLRVGSKTVTLDTRELLKESAKSESSENRIRPRVPVVAVKAWTVKDLAVDPYVLGVWLGDGTRGGNTVTAGLGDAAVMKRKIEECGYRVRERRHTNAVTLVVEPGLKFKTGSSRLINELRELGIFEEKRIPEQYFTASYTHRWALIQGLMDTDGSIINGGSQCVFCNTNEQLVKGIHRLLSSCGVKSRIALCHGIYKGVPRPFYQVRFSPTNGRVPFRMERKAEKCVKRPHTRSQYRSVVSVVPVETGPVSCIQVDAEDGLYLIGHDHVTTHNSSLQSFAKSIQDILINQEIRLCFLSYNKDFAQKIVAQIKREFESNAKLQFLFPDILWGERIPADVQWSVAKGFSVRRKGNPKEQTVEGYGLVDSLPTGGHYTHIVYDDAETEDSVRTPEGIKKTIEAWELSQGIVADSDVVTTVKRYVGTWYHHASLYREILNRGLVKARIYPCTKGGKWPNGESVFLPIDQLKNKFQEMGSRAFYTQMLLDPTPPSDSMFRLSMVRYHDAPNAEGLNVYIFADPARRTAKNDARNRGDYVGIWVIGLGADRRYWVLDIIRERMTKTRKKTVLFGLVDQWNPIMTFWEGGAQNSDVEDFQEHMNYVKFQFEITELSNVDKHKLIPEMTNEFEAGRILLPRNCFKRDEKGENIDLVDYFINQEFVTYPFAAYDDLLNSLAMIKHPGVKEFGLQFPNLEDGQKSYGTRVSRGDSRNTSSEWDSLNDGI